MKRFGLTTSLAIFLSSVVGGSSGAYNLVILYQQEAANRYGHKKLQPLGATDPARAAFGGK